MKETKFTLTKHDEGVRPSALSFSNKGDAVCIPQETLDIARLLARIAVDEYLQGKLGEGDSATINY